MINEIIEFLTKYITEKAINCYYKTAPNSAKFPFVVINGVNIVPSDDVCIDTYNIEIYIMTETNSKDNPEEIAEDIYSCLEGYVYRGTKCDFYCYTDGTDIVYEKEHDLDIRKMKLKLNVFRRLKTF